LNVNLSEQSRTLRIAQHDRTHPSALKADGRNHGIIHFNTGMVVVIPVRLQVHSRPHEETEQVEIVRCLTYDNSASFALPGSTPRIGKIVRRFTPAQHS